MSRPISIDGHGTTVQLLSRLGCGAYGTVFKAVLSPTATTAQSGTTTPSSSPKHFVAVKEMPFDMVADEPSDLIKEIEVLCGIDSPYCIRYLGSFFHDGVVGIGHHNPLRQGDAPPQSQNNCVEFAPTPSICIMQELVEGGSVLEFVEAIRASASSSTDASDLQHGHHRPRRSTSPHTHLSNAASLRSTSSIMSDEQISSIVVDVLHALVYLHDESRVVHRDIKCANILLSVTDGRCRLCDFGTGAKKETAADQRRTTIGTPGWMAPEVWSGTMAHSFPADIWTLGATVLEMSLKTSPSANPLFSQYITVLSQVPCSFVPHVSSAGGGGAASPQQPPSYLKVALPSISIGKSTFSDLDPLVNSPLLFDFTACCLRRDPSQRPTAKDLLQHPFLVENGVATGSPRKVALIKRMANQLLSAALPSEEEFPSPNGVSSEGSNTRRYALGGTMNSHNAPQRPREVATSGRGTQQQHKRDITVHHVFDHGLDNASRVQHDADGASPALCPAALASMWTSEPYRYQPSSSSPSPSTGGRQPRTSQKVTQAGPAAGAAVGHTPPVCGIFADVIVPATAECRITMQRVFSIYRSLGTPPDLCEQEGAESSASAEPYAIRELQSSALSFEQHERLMDRLLQGLHSVENLHHDINDLRSRQQRPMQRDPAVPVNPEESFSLRACQWLSSFLLTNFDDSDNLRSMFEYFEELQQNPFRHHYRLKERSGAGRDRGPGTAGKGPTAGCPMIGTETAASNNNSKQSCEPTYAERVLSAPSVPVYTPSGSEANNGVDSNMMDPAAILFNKWLGEQKQRTWAQL